MPSLDKLESTPVAPLVHSHALYKPTPVASGSKVVRKTVLESKGKNTQAEGQGKALPDPDRWLPKVRSLCRFLQACHRDVIYYDSENDQSLRPRSFENARSLAVSASKRKALRKDRPRTLHRHLKALVEEAVVVLAEARRRKARSEAVRAA